MLTSKKKKLIASLQGAPNEEERQFLINRGWHFSDDGWRHPSLMWGWPFADALRLQFEADRDDSLGDVVHRALRGEP